jgi:hypothetical protein
MVTRQTKELPFDLSNDNSDRAISKCLYSPDPPPIVAAVALIRLGRQP